jgi:hypothetical protein
MRTHNSPLLYMSNSNRARELHLTLKPLASRFRLEEFNSTAAKAIGISLGGIPPACSWMSPDILGDIVRASRLEHGKLH